MKISCIIIEDEPLAAKKLKGFIEKIPFLDLKGTFENPLAAMNSLNTDPPGIVFLDIQMEHLTGIQLLENFSVGSSVIITSAYADYALKGYELNVSDYLLKPYSFERFLMAVNKVVENIRKQNHLTPPKHIFVKTGYRLENINIDDILYVQGMQGYVRIYLPGKKIMTKQGIRSILDQLPSEKFIQVHKSWIVSITKIESIERCRIKIGEKHIPVGEAFKEAFFERLKH